MWFIMGNWLFFWLKFMTISEVGLFDAIAFGIAMVVEIPSGAVADLLGKRKTLILASVLSTLGAFVMAIGTTKWAMFYGNLAFIAGFSFLSGADEALAYDSMVEAKKEVHFDSVASKAGMLAMFATVFATAFGGFLYGLNERFPWYAIVITNCITIVICFLFVEPRIDTEKFNLSIYFKQLILGFKELLTPQLKKFFLLFATLSGVFYMYDTGFIRPTIATNFGFDGVWQSYAVSVLTVVAALVVGALPHIRKRVSDRVGLLTLLMILGVSFFLATFHVSMMTGFFVLTAISIAGNLTTPWISIVVNKRIDSKYRSTTLSTLAFFTKLPYVVVAVVAGSLAESGNLGAFNLSVALSIGVVFLFSSLWLFKKE